LLAVGSVLTHKHPDALTLHDPVHYTPMPFLPYPPTFPVYIPAKKLASFLEDYASILELHVWLSATVTKVYRQNDDGPWNVDVNVAGEKKTVRARHVIFAMGYGSSVPSIPTYPGLVGPLFQTLQCILTPRIERVHG
jgi:cation diffusion facilitator CzcD-associated flavoprotein CzcO